MKLGEVAINVEAEEQGAWIGEKHGTPIPDMGDLCLKVRGLNNVDYRKLAQRLIEAVPRKKRASGRIDPAEQDRVTSVCLRDTVLLDWENVEGDGAVGESGKPVAYDKKIADRLLLEPAYRRFRDAVIWAATQVVEQEIETREDIAGN